MKRLSKKIALFCTLAVCAMSTVGASSMPVQAAGAAQEQSINARSTNLSWVYAYVSGIYCMRLYNHSTGEWLTDWIPV